LQPCDVTCDRSGDKRGAIITEQVNATLNFPDNAFITAVLFPQECCNVSLFVRWRFKDEERLRSILIKNS